MMDENLSASIKQILSQYGTDVLLNGNRFCALVDDLAPNPESKYERRVLQRLNQENLLSEIYKLISQTENTGKQFKLDLLLEEAGFSESWKQIVFEIFQFEDGKEKTHEEAKSTHPATNNSPLNLDLDPELEQFIQDVVNSVGGKGPIIVEESLKIYTRWEHMSGMKLDRGFISPYMVQNEDKGETILEDPFILITDETIFSKQQITKITDIISAVAPSLLIISTDIEESALSELIKGIDSLPCVAIKAPGYGERRLEILRDIATLTGGYAILYKKKKIDNLSLDMFGHASKVIVHYEDTVIVDGKGDKEQLERRIGQIQSAYESSTSDFDREKLLERIDNLTHGVSVIKVGGKKVADIKEQMDIIEKALKIVTQKSRKKFDTEE